MTLLQRELQERYVIINDTPTKVSSVYIGNGDSTATKIRPVWKPDPNRTIFYYDFEDSNNRLADSSGNNNNATSASYISYSTVGGQYVAGTTNTANGININSSFGSSIGNGDYTMSCWIYFVDPGTGRYPMFFATKYDNNTGGMECVFDPKGVNGKGDHMVYYDVTSTVRSGSILASSLYNNWHHIVVTRINGTTYCYVDTALDVSFTDTGTFVNSGTGCIIGRPTAQAPQSFPSGAKGDKFILEKVGWSAADVANYYNQTKGIYGL